MHRSELADSFIADINQIVKVAVDSFGLSYSGKNKFSSPLLRWVDFRRRYISPTPRMVVESDKFPECVPEKYKENYEQIKRKILLGENINDFQSKTLLKNDVSALNKKTSKTDKMFADWGIQHLHFVPKGSGRSSELLFIIVKSDCVFMIDVAAHKLSDGLPSFSDEQIIQTAINNWPKLFESRIIKSIGKSSFAKLSHREFNQARRVNLNTFIENGGNVYGSFGNGLVTNGNALDNVRDTDIIYKELTDLAKVFISHQMGIYNDSMASAKPRIVISSRMQYSQGIERNSIPSLAFYYINSNELEIWEKFSYFSRKMNELLLPKWWAWRTYLDYQALNIYREM